MDMLENLESLQFASEIPEEDRFWLYLQGRSRGLMIEACAHATFFCKVFYNLRELLQKNQNSSSPSTKSGDVDMDDNRNLKVGIIGGGRLGKQLARTLLQLVPIPAASLRISTRRPEVLAEFQKLGVQCFYHNSDLVGWANVIFLCCLPSQLPHICIEIQTSLEKACIVFSFVAAIPIPRLKLLLNHTNILRPQYHCVEDFEKIWGANKEITAALQDPVILRATCPYSPDDCMKHEESCPEFQLPHVISKSYVKNLLHRRPFPWFDLTAVQLRETPFSQYHSTNTVLQDHLTYLYYDSFGIAPKKEEELVDLLDSPSQ
uniref:NADP-dependent oxidoreductase domain-containing protein 1 isoform X2 n=1 Tax=Ictidomys tridecemlineatus TaxID=43179 RepID=UPI001A9D57A5|nr:NADP-dependent oxidoreductase domain-containing protein 1 isoform X2 [Ictidomys tridecemlineatus]